MINVKCKSCRQIGNAPLHFTLVVLHWIFKTAKCKMINVKCKSCRQIGNASERTFTFYIGSFTLDILKTAKCKMINVKCKSCRQIGTHLYILHW